MNTLSVSSYSVREQLGTVVFNYVDPEGNDQSFSFENPKLLNLSEFPERAKDEFQVGNLYLNRKCTGAMVGAHPFGGFNMSGTDSKAGGADYLLLFTQAKSIATRV